MAVFKATQKQRTKRRIRGRILSSGRPFIKMVRSNRYLNALICNEEGRVLASVSSRSFAQGSTSCKNKAAALELAKRVEAECKSLLLSQMAFDRSAYKYHGVLEAFASPLKEAGVLI